jgi:LemA protein
MIGLIVSLAAVAALIAYLIGIYRGLFGLRQKLDTAWANFGAPLTHRHQELRKLIDVCAHNLPLERELLEGVMRAGAAIERASASRDVAAVDAAERQLRGRMSRLSAAAENHDPLKGDETFRRLASRIRVLDRVIAERREAYNDLASVNNIRVHSFPDGLIARHCGFAPAPLLEFSAEAERDAGLGAERGC